MVVLLSSVFEASEFYRIISVRYSLFFIMGNTVGLEPATSLFIV